VRGIRDEYDLVRACADELGHATHSRSEVVGKMYSDESVDIAFYGLESGLGGSRNWDGNGAVGT
jgi:hypothetical protein